VQPATKGQWQNEGPWTLFEVHELGDIPDTRIKPSKVNNVNVAALTQVCVVEMPG